MAAALFTLRDSFIGFWVVVIRELKRHTFRFENSRSSQMTYDNFWIADICEGIHRLSISFLVVKEVLCE